MTAHSPAERATGGRPNAEAVRLLYVATTRARDHLVLSLHRNAKGDKTVAALIEQRLNAYAGDCFDFQVAPDLPARAIRRPGRGALGNELTADFSEDGEQDWLKHQGERIARLAAPPSVEGAGPDAEATYQYQFTDNPIDEDEIRDETDLGRAVRTLLRCARQTGTSLEVDADSLALELAESILSSPIYQQAMSSRVCWRDLPLFATVDGLLLEVSIDLVYETANGLVLALFDLPGALPTAAPGAHPDILARAFEAVTGQKVCAVEVIAASRSPV
jgi:hypothetical protein